MDELGIEAAVLQAHSGFSVEKERGRLRSFGELPRAMHEGRSIAEAFRTS